MTVPDPSQPPKSRARRWLPVAVALALAFAAGPANAYIGPGAGFAFAGSAFVMLATIGLAAFTLLPGRSPSRIAWSGSATRTRTRRPSASSSSASTASTPAWRAGSCRRAGCRTSRSSPRRACSGRSTPRTRRSRRSPGRRSRPASTPSRHNIYDFLTRDPCTYAPMLSSTRHPGREARAQPRAYVDPARQAARHACCRRASRSGSCSATRHIWSSILRVPITFPPEPFRGAAAQRHVRARPARHAGLVLLLLSTKRTSRARDLHRRRADRARVRKGSRRAEPASWAPTTAC